MATSIDLRTDYKFRQLEETKQYREKLLGDGLIELSKTEFEEMLKELGYKIDKSMCLDYFNNLNEDHYNARSMAYRDIKTGQSWAHYEQEFTNGENQKKLQAIRRNYFVYNNGRIWEL